MLSWYTSKALAIALMFWCTGTSCLIVSYARGTMSDTNSVLSAIQGTRGKSSIDAHACCKVRHKRDKRARPANRILRTHFGQLTLPTPTRNGAMSCCPLTSGAIAAASRFQSNNSPALTNTDPRPPNSIELKPAPIWARPRLPNRVHSYLLDCVFLI